MRLWLGENGKGKVPRSGKSRGEGVGHPNLIPHILRDSPGSHLLKQAEYCMGSLSFEGGE